MVGFCLGSPAKATLCMPRAQTIQSQGKHARACKLDEVSSCHVWRVVHHDSWHSARILTFMFKLSAILKSHVFTFHSSLSNSSKSNILTSSVIVLVISITATFLPMQLRLPAPNGRKYLSIIASVSESKWLFNHRSGLKAFASAPKTF